MSEFALYKKALAEYEKSGPSKEADTKGSDAEETNCEHEKIITEKASEF